MICIEDSFLLQQFPSSLCCGRWPVQTELSHDSVFALLWQALAGLVDLASRASVPSWWTNEAALVSLHQEKAFQSLRVTRIGSAPRDPGCWQLLRRSSDFLEGVVSRVLAAVGHLLRSAPIPGYTPTHFQSIFPPSSPDTRKMGTLIRSAHVGKPSHSLPSCLPKPKRSYRLAKSPQLQPAQCSHTEEDSGRDSVLH